MLKGTKYNFWKNHLVFLLPALIYLILILIFATLLPGNLMINFYHDDSFFYIKTANNIAKGLGSTFDGINPTNGYHPLWMLILVLVAKVHSFIGVYGLRYILIVHSIVIIFAVYFQDRFLDELGIKNVWRVFAIIITLGTTGFVDFGVETPILLFTSWFLLYSIFARAKGKTWAKPWLVALLSACVVLSRTDSIIFVSAIGIAVTITMLYLKSKAKDIIAFLGISVFPAFAVYLAFSLYNLVFYGHFETISANLKVELGGTFINHWFQRSGLSLKVRLAIPVIIAIVLCFILVRRLFRSKNSGLKYNLEVLLLGANFYVIAYVFTLLLLGSSYGLGSWYIALCFTIAGTDIAYLLQTYQDTSNLFFKDRTLIAYSIGLLLLLYMCFYIGIYRLSYSEYKLNLLSTGLWLRDNMPVSTRIFQVDASGVTGYFSERVVINGDGLINSWEYQEYLRKKRIREYLQAKRVNYLVTNEFEEDGYIYIHIPNFQAKDPWYYLGKAFAKSCLFRAGPFAVFRIEDINFREGNQKSPQPVLLPKSHNK